MPHELFQLHAQAFSPGDQAAALANPAGGGYATFEGWVRNHNEGREVHSLEYEAYSALALKEGTRILEETREQFDILEARCIHRIGHLQIGEVAVWIGATAKHREDAFAACRRIIDEVKTRVPIWKKEHYVDGDSGWVRCEQCAAHGHTH